MRQFCIIITVALIFLLVGCGGVSGIRTVTLQCKAVEGECASFFSFTAGMLQTPPLDPGQVDLLYYFDRDDCFYGALIGHDDCPGYLFPVGKKAWGSLNALKPPLTQAESVAAIVPLTQDQEGLAFWIKKGDGSFVLARIKSLRPAAYSDLISGGTAALTLEWSAP